MSESTRMKRRDFLKAAPAAAVMITYTPAIASTGPETVADASQELARVVGSKLRLHSVAKPEIPALAIAEINRSVRKEESTHKTKHTVSKPVFRNYGLLNVEDWEYLTYCYGDDFVRAVVNNEGVWEAVSVVTEVY